VDLNPLFTGYSNGILSPLSVSQFNDRPPQKKLAGKIGIRHQGWRQVTSPGLPGEAE